MAKRGDGVKRKLWSKRLAKFDRSNMTVTEFCRREQVSQASFYYWSKQIRQGGTPLAQQQPVTSTATVSLPEESEAGFVEIVVDDSIRVRLPMGRLPDVVAFVKQLQAASRDDTDLLGDSRFQRVMWSSPATLADSKSQL